VRGRPYWSEYPIVLLMNPFTLSTVDPLEIDINDLLSRLLQRMYEHGINFRVSGIALYSSALILRFQTENVLEEYNNKHSRKNNNNENKKVNIPILKQPFSLQYGSASLDELIISFKKALRQEMIKRKHAKRRTSKQNLRISLDELNVPLEEEIDVESIIHDVFMQIKRIAGERQSITFEELIANSDIDKIVQTFLAILYLYFYSKIDITQDDETLQIYITITDYSQGN